jgi:Domain of unknown function (DUF4386)
MTSNDVVRLAGWAAILSAAATVLMVAAAVLTDALHLGNTFAFLLMALMALMIVVALGLHLILRSAAPAVSLAAVAIGILGMLLTVIVHALQIAGALTVDQFNAAGEGMAPGAIGLWLLIGNYLALRGGRFPRVLTVLGLIAGAGYLASGLGALLGGPQTLTEGPQNALSSIGPLGIFLVYPVWAGWLGVWLLRRHTRPEPAPLSPGLGAGS